ncbi:hypothetical protein GIB67_040381 [Kingdonia uniflora]|uniref:Uncharacterized protein n=1 Tax=Kingdonia uniflora TaxID=39325 RepID=A0A7J7KXG8_9MAGN|nr:hypothetical protein GIB67_040381 [Kingdonia uniflora]
MKLRYGIADMLLFFIKCLSILSLSFVKSILQFYTAIKVSKHVVHKRQKSGTYVGQSSKKDRGAAHCEMVVVDLDTLIHNVLLGDGFLKILLSKVMKPRTLLNKDDGYSEDIGDIGEGAYVAWAIWYFEFD